MPRGAAVVVVGMLSCAAAWAQSEPAAPAPPAPYSLPWQLRPTTAATVVRSDSTFVLRRLDNGGEAATLVSMLLASYRISKGLPVAPFVRLGVVHQDSGASRAGAVLNPVIGASWAINLVEGMRANLFLAVALPLGMGGGNTPDRATSAAVAGGVLNRSAMDNAMFAVNDLTVFPGAGVSFSQAGFTLQVEATVLQLTRVRGELASADGSRTNFTTGVHLGYFLRDWLSLGAELRYQRFLSTPVAVSRSETLRDNATFAIGPRLHLEGDGFFARPGFSITVPLDDPMARQKMVVLQVDVPVVF